MIQPSIIKGGQHKDDRGTVIFLNEFDMTPVKRVYYTEHSSTSVIRAWQGHKIERRWFFCVQGAFQVKLVKIDDFENPSDHLEVDTFILRKEEPTVLSIPKGYANGFKALQENSLLMIFADRHFGEEPQDQYKFDNTKWAVWQ